MPVDLSRYPDDWGAISTRIKERAGWQCEQCKAPHDMPILRSVEDPAKYLVYDYAEDVYRWPDGSEVEGYLPDEYTDNPKWTHVILTVHHKGVAYPDGTPGDMHDKMDCRDENLIALCQRCHLIADGPEHVKAMRETVYQRKQRDRLESGFQLLPGFDAIIALE